MMRNLLFVDDDRDMIDIYRINGERAGFTTNVCTSAGEALNFLNNNQVDVVVMDIAMPDIDGLRAAKDLRKNEEIAGREPVELYFLTAYDTTPTTEEIAREVGARKILRKPYEIDRLVRELKGAETVGQMTQGRQTGAAASNWLIVLVAVIAEIVTVSAFFYLNHRAVDWWAIQWANEKSKYEQMKLICDANAQNKEGLEIELQQNNINASAALLTERPCVVETEAK